MSNLEQNTLFTGDNLYILNGMNSNSMDLIYLDPPFNSKRLYEAPVGSKAEGTGFKDIWKWEDVDEVCLDRLVSDFPYMVQYIHAVKIIHGKAMMAYLTYMTQRIIEMHRVLKDTGSLFLHCDPTASHYLKIILDRIFGKNNFRNEIVWCYSTSGRAKKTFAKKHDIILFYSKSQKYYWSDYKIPVSEKYLASHYCQVDSKGRRCRIRVDHGKTRIYYPKDGMICNDWWEIPYVNSQAKERTGLRTQKPLALLERIIKAGSREGDWVLDPFCGCATACVAAQQLSRKWIGIDKDEVAHLVSTRLADDFGLFDDFVHLLELPRRTDLKIVKETGNMKKRLYKEQEKKCNGCERIFDQDIFEIDHIIPRSKGGGDFYENYQLLCPPCNKAKSNKPMEYLTAKIKKQNDALKRITFGG